MKKWIVPSILIAVMAVGTFLTISCQSKVASLVSPAEKVTRPEFEEEVIEQRLRLEMQGAQLGLALEEHDKRRVAFNETVERKRDELDAQDKKMAGLIDIVQTVSLQAANGTVNPTGILTLGISTLAGVLLGALGIKRPGDVTPDVAKKREDDSWDEATEVATKNVKANP